MIIEQTIQVARTAMRTRLKFGYDLDRPCDIYDLVSKHSLSLRFTKTATLDGLYLNDGVSGEISVSALRPAGHQHFTAAHELGHHVFGHGARIDGKVEQMSSNSGDEEVADTFARHVLMPKRAVLTGFSNLGTEPLKASPYEVFQVSSWLGVGYSTLIQHMRWSLNLITNARLHELILKRPQQIKRAACPVASWSGRKELWPLQPHWAGCRVHVQVGDVLTGLCEPIDRPFSIDNGIVIASSVGEVQVNVGSGQPATISVAKTDYVGLYKFRYLEEPLDA